MERRILMHPDLHRRPFLVIFFLTSSLALLLLTSNVNQAQVTPPITSSGLNTQVSGPIAVGAQTQYNITGGTRPGGGTNLFHSFGNFNVPANNIANFLNETALPTSNILARVTGGNLSSIYGTIQTTGFGNANLFLMNPAGFLFGPNATINVGGMVAFTTADYLRLADGARFNNIPDATADALLGAAPVAAFGFLGSNPGAITVQGSQFTLAQGTGISLVGGNITIQSGALDSGTVQPARISAPNGQINLATAASPGEFLLQGLMTGGLTPGGVNRALLAGPNVNGASFTSFGTVHLAPGSTVDTSQSGNSKVSIIGGQFVVDIQNALLTTASTPPATPGQDNVLLNTGSSIVTVTSSADHGPDVQIVADTIQLLGTFIPPSTFTPVVINTKAGGSGTAGNISVTANKNLELSAARIGSDLATPVATGTEGNIDLTSMHGNISLTNETLVTSQGHPGSLTLNAPHGDILLDMSIANTLVLQPGLLGVNGGGIQITANNLTLSNSQNLVPATIEGDNFVNPQVPGNITVTLAGNLSMSGGSSIQTVSRGVAAGAADVNITAHDVSLTGTGLNPPNPQVFNTRINTQTISSGTGGQLNIVADNLSLTNGGQLLSGSVIGRNPFTGQPTDPSGPGGTINIHGSSGPTTSVLIDGAGSGIFTNSQGSGPGGNTNITAQSVTIQNGGVISAQANGSGPGGLVNISADTLQLTNGGQLTSGSVIGTNAVTHQPLPPPSGTAGDIGIQGLAGPAASVLIDGAGSGIFTNTVGTGAGGNTNIAAQSLTIQNGGIISAATSGTAPSATGGTITVKADTVMLTSDGTMTAKSTGAGASGEVVVQGLASPAQSIVIDGAGSGIFTDTHGTGVGGDIHLSANSVTVQNNGTLSAASSGTAASATGGTVTVDGNTVQLNNGATITTATSGPGNAGDILVKADTVSTSGGATITASSTGTGNAGNVTIQGLASPAQSVVIDGTGSGIFTTTSDTGAGGNIAIAANSVTLSNGGTLSASTSGSGAGGTIAVAATTVQLSTGASITAQTTGAGDAGAITITADDSVSLTTGSVITSSSFFGGNGGPVTITAGNSVSLTGGSSIISSSFLGGTGGSVALTAPTVSLQDSGIVTFAQGFGSDVSTGGAGAVTINAPKSLSLVNATIDSSTADTAGNAGRISITSPIVSLSNRSTISSEASNSSFNPDGSPVGLPTDGNGGLVELAVGQLSLADFSRITTQTTGGGQGGSVTMHGLAGPGSQATDVTITSGAGIFTNATDLGAAGSITVDTARLTVSGGGQLQAATIGPGAGGTITIRATEQVTVSGASFCSTCSAGQQTFASQLSAESDGSSGHAGNIVVQTPSLTLADGGRIVASTTGAGQGGTITVQGLDGVGSHAASFTVSGQTSEGAASGLFSTTSGTGAGGSIVVNANTVTLQNGGTLSAKTSGTETTATGGTILVKADTVTLATGGTMTAASTGAGASGEVVVQGLASPAQSILIDGAGSGIFTNTQGTGAGGDIHLFANSVTLQNNGELSAATSGTASSAIGGVITVNAEHVALNNHALITADTNGIAPAGTVDINTGSLALNSGSQIRSSSGAAEPLLAAQALTTTAPLTGGTITIQGRTGAGSQADTVTLDGAGSGIFTQSTGNRSGGDINILASQSVALHNGSTISASSTGLGDAGNIHITAGNQFAMTNSSVTTEADAASGGTIKITTNPGGTVLLTDSLISASVLDGTGGGGSVNIDPQYVILLNSQILAQAVNGPGGNIFIATNFLLPDANSLISASSQFGTNGTITIQSPISPASGKIVPLSQKPLLATSLLTQRCAALAGGNFSSFTMAGRDSLPAEPSSWLSSPLATLSPGTEPAARGEGFEGMMPGTSSAGHTPLLSLRQIAPPGFLTQTFALDHSGGCTS
jgi:filamentous hemagglutinin family protein